MQKKRCHLTTDEPRESSWGVKKYKNTKKNVTINSLVDCFWDCLVYHLPARIFWCISSQ